MFKVFLVLLVLAGTGLTRPGMADVYCDPAAAAATPYASSPRSNGTAANPHLICSLAQLDNVRLEPDSHFLQMADIQAADTRRKQGPNPWNTRFGFEPLFSAANAFTGVYDGNGHTIYLLKINGPGQPNRSLFGVVSSAIIRNLHLKGALIIGGADTAGLVSHITYDLDRQPEIQNASVRGHLIVSSPDMRNGAVGGVVAALGSGALARDLVFAGTIRVQRAAGDIRGVGGIVGYADTLSQLGNCASRATIIARDPHIEFILGVGGVVGTLGRLAKVERCHAFQPKILIDALALGAGGVVGRSDGRSIERSSSRRGFVHSSAEGNGGFMGYGYTTQVTRSWTSTRVSGSGLNGGFVGTTDGGGMSFSDAFASGAVTGEHSGGFIGAILYSPTSTFSRVYASGNVSAGAGILGLLEFNQGEGNHVTILSSFSAGASTEFVNGLFDREAHFLNHNYWYNPLDPSGVDCDDCTRINSIKELFDPNHPVYQGHGGPATAWDFANVWKARPGQLPVLLQR